MLLIVSLTWDFQISENELFGLNFLGNALYELENSISFGKEFYRPNLFILDSNNAVDVFYFESFLKLLVIFHNFPILLFILWVIWL